MKAYMKRHKALSAIVVFMVCAAFLANSVAFCADEPIAPTANTLAAPTQITQREFREKFLLGEFLLSHDAINAFIKKHVSGERDILGEKEWSEFRNIPLRPSDARYCGNIRTIVPGLEEIRAVKVSGLLYKTGQFAHAGLSGKDYDGTPVIYIDSLFFSEDGGSAILRHETDEIKQWESFRIEFLEPRGVTRETMRGWIKAHIDTPDDALTGTPYAGKTARRIAKLFHERSYDITDIYAAVIDAVVFDYEHITLMASLYGLDEASGDVNIAAKAREPGPVQATAVPAPQAIDEKPIEPAAPRKEIARRAFLETIGRVLLGGVAFTAVSAAVSACNVARPARSYPPTLGPVTEIIYDGTSDETLIPTNIPNLYVVNGALPEDEDVLGIEEYLASKCPGFSFAARYVYMRDDIFMRIYEESTGAFPFEPAELWTLADTIDKLPVHLVYPTTKAIAAVSYETMASPPTPYGDTIPRGVAAAGLPMVYYFVVPDQGPEKRLASDNGVLRQTTVHEFMHKFQLAVTRRSPELWAEFVVLHERAGTDPVNYVAPGDVALSASEAQAESASDIWATIEEAFADLSALFGTQTEALWDEAIRRALEEGSGILLEEVFFASRLFMENALSQPSYSITNVQGDQGTIAYFNVSPVDVQITDTMVTIGVRSYEIDSERRITAIIDANGTLHDWPAHLPQIDLTTFIDHVNSLSPASTGNAPAGEAPSMKRILDAILLGGAAVPVVPDVPQQTEQMEVPAAVIPPAAEPGGMTVVTATPSQNAGQFINRHLPAFLEEGRVYEIRYDAKRFREYARSKGLAADASPEKLLQEYVMLLRMRAGSAASVKLIQASGGMLLSVKCYADRAKTGLVGFGEADFAKDASPEHYFPHVTDLVTAAIAVSNIRQAVRGNYTAMDEQEKKLARLVRSIIGAITGSDVPFDAIADLLKHLPPLKPLSIDDLAAYYQAATLALKRSA